jgi:uncharacterized protein YoxC
MSRRDEELERREQLERERDEKRERYLWRPENDDEDDDRRSKEKMGKIPCALITLAIIGLSGYLAYYFLQGIKDPLLQEWEKAKQAFDKIPVITNNLQTQSQDQLKQGQDLLDQVNNTKDQLNKIKTDISDLKNNLGGSNSSVTVGSTSIAVTAESKTTLPEDYVPVWLYAMMNDKMKNDYEVPDFRCDYLSENIYLSLGGPKDCDDCFTDYVYKADGSLKCYAGGGLIGDGDNKCPGLFANLNNCFVWNGQRWEQTIVK